MSRLIIAFESDDIARRVSEMFASASIAVRSVCHTGAEVLRMVEYMGSGVVVCGIKLADMTAEQLFDDLEGKACMLLVAKPEQMELCENPRIFRLPLPVNRYDLSASVRMLEQLEEMNRSYGNKGKPETEAIERAKLLLETKRGLTENQAHHYLQRLSMSTGRKIADVARSVADELTGE